LAYWAAILAGVEPPRLPFAAASASGGAADETRSADLARTLPGAVAASLRQRASAGRTTLFTLVCAAFKTVLHRATLQDDIALCSPVSLRASPADMQEVGLFVSLLPLRSRVAPSMRFSEMLATEATAIAGARSHLLPFEQILAASPLGQSKGNPFSIALGWQETAAAPEPFDGLSVSTSLISHLTTKFDLTLWAEDAADGLRLRLEYRRAVLGVAEAACLADALCALLNQLAAGADDPIEALSLASPEARRAVLHDWQGSRRAWPDPCLVPDAIAAQAASTPDRIALHEAETGRTMSYAALLNAADRLAAGLLSRGLAEESRIGVALPRGIPMAAALLGILRAGAAFVPLDPALPASRLHRMAARAGVAFVLGDKPDCLDADVPWAPPDTIATAPDAAAMPRLRAQSLAYVLFTSGSTGEPKGAMNEHGAFFNRLAWMIDTYGFSPADRVLQKTPLGFDVSLWEIFAPLMVGATVVLARQGGQADPAYLAETMRRARISIVHFVPSMLDAYLAAGARLPGLRLLVTSGEALSPSCAQRVLDLAPQTMRLANLYGPTEAAIDVTACDIDAACGSVPIGAPISNTRILILDRTGQPVPPGILGEILIGGIAAGRGYAGRPDLTADRFLPDPFATAPGARLYRTGDLGFWRADGRIAYAGRADQQVKLRGQRIELGEIAETLQRTGLIDSAASVVLDAGTPDARIATAVVPHAAIAGPITAWAQRMTACPVPPEAVFTAPDGTPLLHMNAGESRFLWQEIFEDRVYDVPGLALAPGDTVIDAGANIGMFALWAARRAPGIALYAYEPVPDVFAVLRANLQIHVPGARAFNLGLGARAAVARLAFFPRNTIISGLSADPSSRRAAIAHRLLRDAPELAVDSRRFAELLDHAMQMCEIDAQIATLGEQIALLGLDRIDLLKIDVEGAEEAVLDGLGDAGWRSIRQILIEASSSDGAAERIAHRLTARGYAVRTAPGNAGPGLILLHATAPSLRTVPAQPSCGQPSRGQPSRDLPRSAAALQQSLRAAIADNLPPVMQPASLTVLPSLPLLPSGKLDRASLAAVLAGTPADTAPRPVPVSADRPEPPPAHPLLGAILEVFAQTLPPPAPSEADAHFFRLGGHSLSAIRAVTALETRLGVRIGLQALMAHPVAAALAAHIATLQPAGQPTGTPAAEPNPDILPHPPVPAPHASPTHAPFPQTPIQQAYWIGRNAGLVLGNMATQGYIEIETDSLDIERLSEALRRLVARHPMLRAVATPDGQQRILDDVPVISLATEDLGGLAPAQLVAALEEKRRAMSHCVRDLTQWPLFDLAVSVCAADRYRLHLGLDAFAVDGASLRLLIRDLAEFYADPDVAMTPIGVTFEAYARALAASPAPPASRKYWLDRLPDLPPPPPLPYTTPLADIATPLVTRRALHLNPAETASLRAAAAAHGITMSALVLAVFAEHLAYASGARHFVLCITNACRRQLHPDIDRVVGNFTGVVVFEADLRGAPGFRDTAIRLRDRLALDLEHADFDGVEVQRALARARGSQADAVIPVVFTGLLEQHGAVATDAAARERGFLDLRRSIHGVSQTSQVALDCTAVAVADTIEIFLDAVEAALPCQLLDEMRDGFAASLQRLADPASWTGQLIAGPDQDVLLRRFPLPQAPDAPAWAAQCRLLHEPVFRAMDRYPNAVALDWPGGTLRYAALRAAVARLAAQIAARGARRGELVAIVMEKGPEQIVAVLAILAAGAAYVPIDALLPPRRQADMVAIAETRMVVTQPHLATDVASLGAADILLVDLELPEAATSPADWRPAPVHHSDLAYVIFTSGSTGAPKGVMMEHAAALNTVRDICERVSVTQDDAVLSVSSLGFDLSVWDIFGVLGSGGRLVLPAASALADPSGWAERVETRRVTLWNSVPALAKLLAEAAGARPGALACLRAALLSGDWIPLDLPMQLRRLRPGLRLLALGGATEAAIWSIGHEIADTPHTGNSIPYGRALAGQTVSVRDAELRECPDLVVGEICIGGIGLARGYWRDPLRTARRFVTHPQTGERLYLTGDLGRVATDGEIILLGRADHQIKLNGHRLELGEVEHALERHPGISRAIVLVDQPSSAVRRLVAHVLPAPHALQDQRPEEPGAALRAVARPEAEALDFAGALEAGWRAAFRSDTETGTAAADMDAHIGRMTDTYLVSVLHALAELGLFTAPGECRRSDQVTGSGLVEPRYRRWLDRAFAYLAQDGALRALPDGSYQCEAPLRLRAARALDRASRPRPEPWLAGILRGSDSAAERYVAESMAAAYRDTFMHSNMVAAEAAEALLARRPGQAFGLLEVGAGYGSLTEHLLPLLAPQDTYLFTDVSPFFLNRARDVFAHPGLGFGMLDLDRAPECQGYAGSRFDVIVAASVLHAVKDIRRTLRRLTSLLKPGGALLLIEETAFYPFFDLGMGLQAGFDSFTDTALRPHHPLLSRDAWRRELEAAGFAAATVFARGDRVMDRLGFDVILTRGPALVPAVDEFALRDFLEAHLPVHAVPREFRLLTELPLTGNGKIDRAALAASPAARPAAVQPSPPQTPEEQALAPIWQAVLQLDQVSTAENFFAAGGDSLLAARLAMQLRAGFGITLPVRAIFEAPVFSDLAVLVGLARAAAALPGETLVSGEL
jgi:pyochelin synthetase